jgi:uncharacterized membrane protein (UPF0127 family)
MMKILMAALVASSFAVAAPAVVELPATTLTIGKQKVVAEVAATPEQRSTGLMYRFSLKPDHGMIFVFETAEPQAFWMKNTFVPLSIAYIGSDGRILNIADMAPQDERTHWSSGPAQYALEMRKGWFVDHGVAVGDKVEGLPATKR